MKSARSRRLPSLIRHCSFLTAILILCALSWAPQQLKSLLLLPKVLAQSPAPTPTPTPSENALTDQEKDAIANKQKEIEDLRQKLKDIEGQKVSLSSTIQLINTRINLQQAQINQTQSELDVLEKQLKDLSTRINGLEQSLEVLSDTLIARINETYRQSKTNPIHLLFVSDGMTEFFTRYHYVQLVQTHTREVMEQAEAQKMNFDEQKQIKAEKQAEVEKKKAELQGQKNQLTKEREGQQQLLTETQNNEAQYQAQLQKTLAEIEAIQGIIAGNGNETKIRDVAEGERIASVIVGASPCSTGTHLHFEVVAGSAHQNPANYLKSISPVWNNSPDGSFSFNGNWEWPLNDPARINQGYGMTYYARVRRAYGGAPHTGIDIVSKTGDMTVKSVKSGALYRGGIKCGSGILKYVRVIHPDNLSTYYLHVNY